MEILIVTGITAVFTLWLYRRRREKPKEKTSPVEMKIADINTLLQNVEVYDGTSKGQKKIGGDHL